MRSQANYGGLFYSLPGFATRLVCLAVCILICGVPWCECKAESVHYTDVPFDSYKTDPATLTNWAQTFNDKAIAQHGWSIWAQITADSGQLYNGRSLPKWDTWFTEADVFDRNATPADVPNDPVQLHPFHLPHQGGTQLASFNKYNMAFKKYILENGFNKVETLLKINNGFSPDTPIEKRELEPHAPLDGIVLKPTYWAVHAGEATPVPYWKGPGLTIAGTVQPRKPTDATWTQVVLVNDTGQSVRPKSMKYVVYAEDGPKEIDVTASKVVTIDDFYTIKLTTNDIAFIRGPGNIFQIGGIQVKDLRVGDYLLLVGIHVATVEWSEWTWQTFWWSPFPEDPYGARDPKIKTPFTNYNMASAYYMIGKDKKPHVTFNPHLETPIVGPIYMDSGISGKDHGSESNCMSCHHVAAFPTVNGDPSLANALLGSYKANGDVTGNEQFFRNRVNTHNMWGMVLGLQGQKEYAGKR